MFRCGFILQLLCALLVSPLKIVTTVIILTLYNRVDGDEGDLLEQVEKVGGVGQEEGRVAFEKHLKLLARDIRLQQVHLVFACQIFRACFTILDFDIGAYINVSLLMNIPSSYWSQPGN